MKVNSTLIKYVKNMNGSLIGVGIKDLDIIHAIDKNKKITMCDLLNSISPDSKNIDKKRKKQKYIKIFREFKAWQTVNLNIYYLVFSKTESLDLQWNNTTVLIGKKSNK